MNKEQLIEELLNKNLIRICESISYQRFQQIHSSGYSHIPEYKFAELLGINNGNFNNIKNKGQTTIILEELEDRLANKIAEDLLGTKKIEVGQRINYEIFCKFHRVYSYISEARLGRFLELNDDDLYRLRKGKEVTIYRSQFSLEKMVQILIAEGLLNPGYKIDYSQFLNIYTIATQAHPSLSHFSQYAFAKLLEIRKSTFSKFKAPSSTIKLQILKSLAPKDKKWALIVSDEERRIIVKDLITSKGAKSYESCNYQRFKELYYGYEQYSEYNFALILDVSKSNFSSMKRGKEARILKDCLDKEDILSELLASGKLQIGEKINYQKFNELYKDYEYLGVYIFADIIEVNENVIENLQRDSNATTVVLKSRIQEIKQTDNFRNYKEQAKKYVETLFQTGKIHIGQEIKYEEFQEIYAPCNYIVEHEFATLLGISYFKYQNMRSMGGKTYIHDYRVIESVNLIGKIEKSKFYSKEEIDDICTKYGITQEDFTRYIIYKGNQKIDITAYLNALNNHNGLFIGKTKMSNHYFEKIYDISITPINRLIGAMCKKYHVLRNMEDYKSEAILYIIENCGDIEKNFFDCENQEIIVHMLIARIRLLLLNKIILHDLKVDTKQKSTSYFYTRRDNKNYDILDKKSDTEEMAISHMDPFMESEIMCELIRKFELGLNKKELLESVMVKFDISQQDLLELLSKRLELKKKNREDISISEE